jgi:hypothetical protein
MKNYSEEINKWLDSKGGLTIEDVEKDKYGYYVFIINQLNGNVRKTYLPSKVIPPELHENKTAA